MLKERPLLEKHHFLIMDGWSQDYEFLKRTVNNKAESKTHIVYSWTSPVGWESVTPQHKQTGFPEDNLVSQLIFQSNIICSVPRRTCVCGKASKQKWLKYSLRVSEQEGLLKKLQPSKVEWLLQDDFLREKQFGGVTHAKKIGMWFGRAKMQWQAKPVTDFWNLGLAQEWITMLQQQVTGGHFRGSQKSQVQTQNQFWNHWG